MYNDFYYARVAQLVEHSTDTRKVPGSTPGARTKIKAAFWRFLFVHIMPFKDVLIVR